MGERRISMNAGTEKQLSCRASGAKPQAKIVWYHGHNKILDQEYSKQITNGHREGTWDTVNTLNPALESSYTMDSNGMFECLESKELIVFSMVNDDYCDCKDGSDEPSTSACPGTFFCPTS